MRVVQARDLIVGEWFEIKATRQGYIHELFLEETAPSLKGKLLLLLCQTTIGKTAVWTVEPNRLVAVDYQNDVFKETW